MNPHLVDIARKAGVDKSIAYSSGSRVIGGLAGVLSIYFITTYLTGVEQGFYFTFGSLLAMQVFFELGLTGIMIQFVAHEASHLTLNENLQYEGDKYYISRLASLIHFCVKWYFLLSVIVFAFLMIVGFVYFDRYGGVHNDVDWQIPWILICLGTAIKLFQSPFNSIYMGLGKVKEMSKIGFFQQFFTPIVTWIGFICGLKLYVVGIGYLLSVILWQVYVNYTGLITIIIHLWKVDVSEKVVYLKEIFPFQWRIALSWISGYFIFQLFNPVLFATEGAIVAGQMGLTLQVLNKIQEFSMSWLNTKVPLYSQLIALKNYSELDNVFNLTLKQMVSVCTLLLAVFFFGIWTLHVTELQFGEGLLADRFLPYIPLFLMIIPVFLQQFVSSWATYLRCHKKEPFLWNSITCGIICSVSTIIMGKLFGLFGMTIGYCIISIMFFPWSYWIYKTKKAEWHEEK